MLIQIWWNYETTSQKKLISKNKKYEGYTQYWSEKHQCIKISYHGTLKVYHCPAENLLQHFFAFLRKANLRFMLHTGMNDPNVNLKFEELLWLSSSENFKHLNASVLSIGTCPLRITHNWFRSGITKLDFNVDSSAIDINFFYARSCPQSRLHWQ